MSHFITGGQRSPPSIVTGLAQCKGAKGRRPRTAQNCPELWGPVEMQMEVARRINRDLAAHRACSDAVWYKRDCGAVWKRFKVVSRVFFSPLLPAHFPAYCLTWLLKLGTNVLV